MSKAVGAHVLVRRGGCSFLAKALTVWNAGGRSLLLIDEGAGRLRMEAEHGEHVDLPAVMVSQLDGEHGTVQQEMLVFVSSILRAVSVVCRR